MVAALIKLVRHMGVCSVIRPFSKFAVIVSVLLPSIASASYVTNYSRWKEIPPPEQAAYLAGVMDEWTRTSTPGEQPWLQPMRTGINKCIREQLISAEMLVDLVNAHYKAHTPDWRLNPAVVLTNIVTGTCLADVNSERAKVGLEPWERQPPQISKDN